MKIIKKSINLNSKKKAIQILGILLVTTMIIITSDPVSFGVSNDSKTDNGSKLRISQTGWIEVTVQDSITSDPLQSTHVMCYDDSDVLVDDGYTNSSGMYTITGLDIGGYTVYVQRNGYIEQSRYGFINWDGDDDYMLFNLVAYPPGSGYIEVTVRDSVSSLLIENAYVKCFYNPTMELVDSGYTNSTGFYKITGLYIGTHIVDVSYPGYIRQSRNNYINWNGDDDYLLFNLVPYPPSSGIIKVTVNDSVSSLPVENAFVECWNKPIVYLETYDYTDSLGKVILDGLAIGGYKVNVSKNGYFVQAKDVDIDWNGEVEEIHFDLVPYPPYSGYIEVQVNNSATSLPIQNGLVECFNKSSMALLNSSYTDSYGFYNVSGLAVGDYMVNVSYNGFYRESKNRYINWSGDYDSVTFNLVPYPPDSGYIDVNVYDADTLIPLENALVEWYYSNGTYIDSVFTSASGYYKITGLEIGNYIVNVSKKSYIKQSKGEDINWNGDHDDLDFFLQVFSIEVLSPTNAESWEISTSHYVSWTSIGSIPIVKIELYNNDVLELEIVSNTANDGEFEWLIPASLENSDHYQIKVSDVSNPSIFDISDYFQIYHLPSDTPSSPSVHGINVWIFLGAISFLSLIILRRRLNK